MIPTSPKSQAPAHSSTSSIGRWLAFLAAASAIVIAAACGSDGDDGGGNSPDAGASNDANGNTGSQNSGFDAGAGEAKAPLNCTPPSGFDDCTGKCGPLRDPCTGVVVKQCGGCQGTADGGGPLVCDLEKNNCITPKITCTDLGAECGRLRNSCGVYIDCPAGDPNIECPLGDPDGGLAGQECDPDTKKCRTATSVTCADLGYECGQAWLGVGPKTNLTDCGDCSGHADRPRCNSGLIPEYHVCEPACTPPTTAADKLAFCNAAKTSRGIQCGIISDGCGNAIDCSEVSDTFVCKDGKSCGVRGVANRCDLFETPDECIAAGRNCGTLKSVCSGLDVSCGTCTGTDVCNANGVCGPPCVPKKCADLSTPQPECLPPGTPVPDGCGGNITDCPVCPGGPTACQADPTADAGSGSGNVGGKCCTPTYSCTNRPSGVAANACGSTHRFDNGCGVMIECDCGTGGVCASDGTCCAPNACPAPGAVDDACGTVDRGCGLSCNRTCANDAQNNNNVCTAGKCCNPEPDNATEWRTANPGRCAFNIANGCGGVIDAPCTAGSCINVAAGPGTTITDPGGTTASAIGYCCSNPNANCDTTNTCTTVPNACVTGATVNCGAAQCPDGADTQNDEVCFTGDGGPLVCCDPATCAAAQPAGSACGTGSFDRGCGLTCNPGCANDAQGKTNVCNAGTCCNPEPDDAAEWRVANPGDCAFNVDNGCGGLVDAPCGSGQICQNGGAQVSDVGTTFASGSCCTSADSCGGGPKPVGQACVVDNICLNGSQTVQCACAGGAVCYQNNCCAPVACPAGSGIDGPCGTFDRGCGQTCQRTCAAGTCFQGSCCQPSACPGAAPIGGACGTVSRGCGQSCSVACDTNGNKGNNTCSSGTCTCTPTPCPPGFTGSMQNGCGQIVACTGS